MDLHAHRGGKPCRREHPARTPSSRGSDRSQPWQRAAASRIRARATPRRREASTTCTNNGKPGGVPQPRHAMAAAPTMSSSRPPTATITRSGAECGVYSSGTSCRTRAHVLPAGKSHLPILRDLVAFHELILSARRRRPRVRPARRGAGVKPRVLLVALDGATPAIVSPLLESGALPHLHRIVENGASGTLAGFPRRSYARWPGPRWPPGSAPRATASVPMWPYGPTGRESSPRAMGRGARGRSGKS